MAGRYGCDVPGRDRDLVWLVARYEAIVAEGRGRIVFVVGDEGSGRSVLLRALVDAAASVSRHSVVVAGGFEDGSYVAWDKDPPRARVVSVLKQVISVGEPAASLAGGVLPFGGLLAQVLSRSKAALELAEGLLGQRDTPDLAELMPRVLRRLCEDSPVVCIVDDADQAESGWWADFVVLFARRIARDLPLLLVLAVDGPPQLRAHEDDESATMFVARQLTADGLARWHPLTAVTVEDLRRWTGGATGDVARAVLEVTGGRADWTAQLWSDLKRRDVLEQLDDGRWHFAADRQRTLDAVEDTLGKRLKRLVGAGDLDALTQARRLLACAALEGRRFTADAVAVALERDRDEVIDDLDDRLALEDGRPEGLIVEDGSVAISDEAGQRCLWLYRFNAQLDWLTLRHHGLTEAEQRDLALRLARAMQTLYGGQSRRVAQTLTRLYETAGDAEAARHYRRMGDIGVSHGSSSGALTPSSTPQTPRTEPRVAARRRASQILIAAADTLVHSGPFDDGLAFAQAGHRLAPLRSDQAMALYLTGAHHAQLGAYEPARVELARVIDLCRELGDRRGEAAARHQLALIDLQQGAFEPARAEFACVLDLRRELGDRAGEAAARHALASIDLEQGAFEPARAEFARVLDLWRELGDRAGEAATRHALALIDLQQGAFEPARAEFARVLDLWRELGDRRGEAATRHALASIDLQQGAYEPARAELARVIDLRRELGDRRGEAAARHELASIDLQQGAYEPARAELARVIDLRRELGDRRGEAAARHELASIDLQQGAYEPARAEFARVLDLWRELGDRRGEAAARHALANIDEAMEG